jgi:hypothetical protein
MKTLSDTGYEILRDAVNVARITQCKSLKVLELRLKTRWPGKNKDIADAIIFWSYCLGDQQPDGVASR